MTPQIMPARYARPWRVVKSGTYYVLPEPTKPPPLILQVKQVLAHKIEGRPSQVHVGG